MIYGYSEKVANEESGLLQMKEISFVMEPEQLKLVATFLSRMAEQLESGEAFLHRHIEEVLPEWRALMPHLDIIVIPEWLGEIPDIDS